MDYWTLVAVNLLLIAVYAVFVALHRVIFGRGVVVHGVRWFVAAMILRGIGLYLYALPEEGVTSFLTLIAAISVLSALALFYRSYAEVLEKPRAYHAWNVGFFCCGLLIALMLWWDVWPTVQPTLIALLASVCALQSYLAAWMLRRITRGSMRRAGAITGMVQFTLATLQAIRVPVRALHILPVVEVRVWFWIGLLINGGMTFSFVFLAASRLRVGWGQLAEHDELTGLWNRRGLEASVKDDLDRSPVAALLVLELDELEAIKERVGYLGVEALVKAAAHLLTDAIPLNAILAHLDRGEFWILLPGMDATAANIAAERIRRKMEQFYLNDFDIAVGSTVSIGISALTGDALNWDALMQQAEQSLYLARRSGRNRVYCYTNPLDDLPK